MVALVETVEVEQRVFEPDRLVELGRGVGEGSETGAGLWRGRWRRRGS
jgi:hypothetical protein